MAEPEAFIESLCKHLYEPATVQQRAEAEKALMEFSESSDCLQKCLVLLERGSSAYSQLVASTTLCKLISKPTASVQLQDRIDLRNYLVNYLVSRPKLPNFVQTSLCQLFARLTKLGWFDCTKEGDFAFRSSVAEILKQIEGSICELAVDLLSHLVAEMNQQNGLTSISKHRKIAASFRDEQLFDIFQACLKLLTTACDNIAKINFEAEGEQSLIGGLLRLALNCLTFDFIGSITDDTADDNVSIQVPTTWRIAFVDGSIVKLFYSLYLHLPRSLSSMALSCVVQLSSVRRTIFNNAERQQFLTALVNGVRRILLEDPRSLTDQNNYHEFCRLIARLKSNYQLIELVKVDDYAKLINLIADFTVQSLMMFQYSANSIHYLLSFWQRMISSMAYVKATEPHSLEHYTPSVTKAYIESRINIVTAVVRDGLEDPLDDHASLSQQMEQFAIIGRCEYDKTCQLLIQLFDQGANAYQKAVAANNRIEEVLEQNRLTWLIYFIGAVIGGRVSFSNSEEYDKNDGELICRVLQLVQLTDLADHRSLENLEHAYLWFLDQFRKIYISDQVQKASKVFSKLSEVLGLNDETMILAVFVRKIITNLKNWSHVEKIVDDTLTLLNDLSIGYSSVRRLVRLQEVQFLMNNHTSEHFSFLGPATDLKTMKSRTTFYTALTRLLCVDLGDEEEQLEQFLAPLANSFAELAKVFALSDSVIVGQVQVKKAIIGLARDLRGVAFACNMKIAYLMLFDWIYPNILTVLQRAIEVWHADPDLTTPILKLMTELCQNRSQRLQFEVSLPNAILLFKEASKMICAYGSRILTQIPNIPKDQFYRMQLKGTTIAFSMLKAALSGSYVNFGVFRLYGDTCLDDALSVFMKLLLAIPQTEILAYSKLSQNYYFLLECIAQDHIAFLAQLEPHVFVYILQTLHDGLTALDTMICTGCCQTLDYIIGYLYKRVSRAGKPTRSHAGLPPESDNCLRTLELHPEVLRQMLSTILNVLMFEECRNQWSMSRPLLGLILLNEDYFNQLKVQLVNSQSVEKQATLAQCFTALMENVERNLSIKNKDRFTQNLTVFRREANDCIRGVQNQNGAEGLVLSSDYTAGTGGGTDYPRTTSYADMMAI